MTVAETTPRQDVSIESGQILVYRVFDIGEEVDLVHAEKHLTEKRTFQRFKLSRTDRRSLVVRDAPVTLHMGECDVQMGQSQFKADVSARIWHYGVCSILFQIPIKPQTQWDDLVTHAALIERDTSLDDIARRYSKELSTALASALKHPNEWDTFEDYTIFFLDRIQGITTAQDLARKVNIPSLILAETREQLAKDLISGIMENAYQYGEHDLAVIDWNSAFVYERNGTKDIPDVIEFAVTHLLEMRYYDDLLDQKLDALYDDIESRKQTLFRDRFTALSKESSSMYIEFSEFLERVENSFKIVGDSYLATIFRAATRRFRFNDWQQNISRKMNIVAQISELLEGQINVRRNLLLEAVIVLLIAFEIVSALFFRH